MKQRARTLQLFRSGHVREWLNSLRIDVDLRISYTMASLVHQERVLGALDERQILRSNADFFEGAKTSDKLFILGSGSSIRNLEPEDFDEFRSNDTLALNMWVHHEFVPRFYLLQRPKNDSAAKELWNLARLRRLDYSQCKILLRGDGWRNREDVEDFINIGFGEKPALFLKEWPVYSKSRVSNVRLVNFLQASGFLNFGELSNFTPKFGSSLLLAVVLGFQMGYKDIVLVGVDNDQGGYFFESTMTSSRNSFEIAPQKSQNRWLSLVDAYFREASGSKIWVYNNSSSLSKMLPTWKNAD